ncbi:MAG TPA: hypothetical protein VMY05_10725 [Acidobacteriota bacterium]|nr:hypothetical protein [Acidobacteriota bacterium]
MRPISLRYFFLLILVLLLSVVLDAYEIGHALIAAVLLVVIVAAFITAFSILVIDFKRKTARLAGAVGIGATLLWLGMIDTALSLGALAGIVAALALIKFFSRETVRSIGLLLLALVVLYSGSRYMFATLFKPDFEVVEYSAVVKDSFDEGSFLLTETFTFKQKSSHDIALSGIISGDELHRLIGGELHAVKFPCTIAPSVEYTFVSTRTVTANKAGFLLKRCEFRPLSARYIWSLSASEGGSETISSLSDARYATRSRIEVWLPRGSFSGANGKSEAIQYGNVEIITWELPFKLLQRDIGFVYVDPPFHTFAWLIRPFAGISSLGALIATSIGLAIAALGVIPLLAFRDVIKEKIVQGLLYRLHKRRQWGKQAERGNGERKGPLSPSAEEAGSDAIDDENAPDS